MSYHLLSDPLKRDINCALKAVYTSQLPNAKYYLHDLVIRAEKELGENSATAIKLNKKFIFDLRNYRSKEEAVWFLNERTYRCPEAKFETFLLTQCLTPPTHDTEFVMVMNQTNPLKLLITQVLMANWYHDHKTHPKLGFKMSALIRCSLDKISKLDITQEDDIYFLSYAYIELAFLTRAQTKTQLAINYFRRALHILRKSESVDFEQCLIISTYILKYLNLVSFHKDISSYNFQDVLIIMTQLMNQPLILYDFKTLRQAFIQVSKTQHSVYQSCWTGINNTGKKMITPLSHLYDIEIETNHLCMNLKFNSAYNQLKCIPDFLSVFVQWLSNMPYGVSKPDLFIMFNDIVQLKEVTRNDLSAKISSFYNLSKLYVRFDLDFYEELCCRETLRLSELVYGENHYRLIDPMRHLAMVLKKQAKHEEGKKYMAKVIEKYSQVFPLWYYSMKGKEMIHFMTCK